MQRADTKAATFCATGLAGLAAVAAAATAWPAQAATAAVALWVAGALQLASIAVAVLALRPSLRAADRSHRLSFVDLAGTSAGEALMSVRRASTADLMRADSHRAVELSALARRKYALLRHAATLLVLSFAAVGAAGLLAAATGRPAS
jgi:hypothetical protein